MTPEIYCRQKACQEGSSLYYSLRLSSAADRWPLTVLHTLFREFMDIPTECSDAGIASIKLEWWKNEIAQAYEGTSHHPAAQALGKLLPQQALPQSLWQQILTALMNQLHVNRYANAAELVQYGQQTSGTFMRLCAMAQGATRDKTLDSAEKLGVALHFYAGLRHLRQQVQRGILPIADNELRQFSVTDDQLFNSTMNEQLQALLAWQTTRIRAHCHQFVEALPDTERPRQLFHLVRMNLMLATLTELEKEGYPLFHQHLTLPPLRKLWIAWRTVRHAKRCQLLRMPS